jgi:hypothetical protein
MCTCITTINHKTNERLIMPYNPHAPVLVSSNLILPVQDIINVRNRSEGSYEEVVIDYFDRTTKTTKTRLSNLSMDDVFHNWSVATRGN